MEFKRTGPNAAEIRCNDGTRILFSYGEPVAAYDVVRCYIRVGEFVSDTTERHIREFLAGAKAKHVTREELRALAKAAA